MGFVEAAVFGDKEDAPIPELFVAVVVVQSILDRIAFSDVERGQDAFFAEADQHVDAGAIKFGATDDLLVARAVEDNTDARPVGLFDQTQTIGVAVGNEDANGERALEFRILNGE